MDSSKGCLDFWVSKSKIQKNSRKKMDFCKNPTFTCIFWMFWKNPSFSLSFFRFLISGLEKSIFFLGIFWIFAKIYLFPRFFWIFDIRIGKIHLFPRCFLDFCKNQSFSLGFLLFLKNPSFSLSFFGFLTWQPKNPNTLSKNPKKSKKTLGNPKIHLFDLNPKILFEKMDFWIFG